MGWKWWQNDENTSSSNPQNTQQQPQYHTQSFFRSYSSSRSCKPDPEDNNFMICKEKINDGNQTYEKEERIEVNSNYGNPQNANGYNNFGLNVSIPLDSMQSSLQKQFDAMEKEFSQFMNPIFNFPSFFGMGMFPHFADGRPNFFQNHPNAQQEGAQQNQHNQQYQQRQQRPQNQRSNPTDRFSFSQQEKDYNIKDI